jgi:hypothetical protein
MNLVAQFSRVAPRARNSAPCRPTGRRSSIAVSGEGRWKRARSSGVNAGLDPAIHLAKKMDARVRPAGDGRFNKT